jgi:hypothetical protein
MSKLPYLTLVNERALPILGNLFSHAQLRGCPMEALGSLAILVLQPEMEIVAGYQERKDAALDITSQWLSLRRTPSQVNRILSMNCSCPPSRTEHVLHRCGQQATLPGFTAGQLLIRGCTRNLQELHYQMKNLTQYSLYSLVTRGTWPRSTRQLLPHNPEATIRGYMDWLSADAVWAADLDGIMKAALVVIQYTWPVGAPVMVKMCLLPRHFVTSASRSLVAITTLMQINTPFEDQTQITDHLGLLVTLLMMMRTVAVECSEPTAAAHFLKPQHEEILIKCDRILSAATSINQRFRTTDTSYYEELAFQCSAALARLVYIHFPDCRIRSPPLPASSTLHYWSLCRDPDGPPHRNTWEDVVDILQSRCLGQHCCAPGCSVTPEERGRPLDYCTGCRCITYCSRVCQKEAWRRTDGLQHRNVCGLIRFIRSRHYIPRSSKPGLATNTCIPDLSPPESTVVNAISAHFAALALYDIQNDV